MDQDSRVMCFTYVNKIMKISDEWTMYCNINHSREKKNNKEKRKKKEEKSATLYPHTHKQQQQVMT